MKRQEAAACVTVLLKAFPTNKADEDTIRIYTEELQDLEFVPAQRAVQLIVRTSRFFPTVAEIREAYVAVTRGPVRSGAEAWVQDVLPAMRAIGAYGSPKFTDPVTASIVSRWGWVKLCTEGDEIADRSRFIETYNAMAGRARIEEVSGIPLARRLGEPGPARMNQLLKGA